MRMMRIRSRSPHQNQARQRTSCVDRVLPRTIFHVQTHSPQRWELVEHFPHHVPTSYYQRLDKSQCYRMVRALNQKRSTHGRQPLALANVMPRWPAVSWRTYWGNGEKDSRYCEHAEKSGRWKESRRNLEWTTSPASLREIRISGNISWRTHIEESAKFRLPYRLPREKAGQNQELSRLFRSIR